MTIIDTTLYANGALRLSRHGAGRGGNVLVHVASGRSVDIDDRDLRDVERILDARYQDQNDIDAVFQHITHWRGRSALDGMLRRA